MAAKKRRKEMIAAVKEGGRSPAVAAAAAAPKPALKPAAKPKAKTAKPSAASAGSLLIGRYHELLKKLAQLPPADAARAALQAELEGMGGLEAYQKVSLAGESVGGAQKGSGEEAEFDSSDWALRELSARHARLRGDLAMGDPLRLGRYLVQDPCCEFLK